MALPTTLTSFAWPGDGIGYCGPFISSAGNVYVLNAVGYEYQAGAWRMKRQVWKATDPTSSFTLTENNDIFGTNQVHVSKSLSAIQSGDIIYLTSGYQKDSGPYGGSSFVCWAFDMSTDTWASGGAAIWSGGGGSNGNYPVSYSGTALKRATNNDAIGFCNTVGVTTMGKTYSRIYASRNTGAVTQIGILPTATTQQSESVDSMLLGSSDRVHLFWTQTSSTAGGNSIVKQRTVKSTDNLDGTQPATGAVNVATAFYNSSAADVMHLSGTPFLSSGGVIAVPYATPTPTLGLATATSADSPTWSTAEAGLSPITTSYGATTNDFRFGGAPWDGTNKTVALVHNSTLDPTYNMDTGSGFASDGTSIESVTGSQISANVFQRGNNIVLAVVYDKSGTWVYNEVVLRTAGLSGAITPVTITLTPQALSGSGSGDASRDLTNATLTLTPVALGKSVGGVTASISPVVLTLTPTEVTGQLTIDPQYSSISPVVMTLSPQSQSASVGEVSRTLGVVTITLTPVVFTHSLGERTHTIGVVIITLTPIALGRSVGTAPATLGVPIITLTPVAFGTSVGTAPATLGVPTINLNPIALTTSVGDAQSAVTPVVLSLTPFPLSGSAPEPGEGSIAPVILSLNSIVLTPSIGDVAASIEPVVLTLLPITITKMNFGSIEPVVLVFEPQTLVTSIGDVNRTVDAVIVSLTPTIFEYSIGDVNRTIDAIDITLTPNTLDYSLGGVNSTLDAVALTLTPIIFEYSIGGVNSTLDPVILTLMPITLTYLGGGNYITLEAAIITLTPIALTPSIGDVSVTLGSTILTLTPTIFEYSIGGVNSTLDVAIITLSPIALTPSIGDVSVTLGPITLTLTPFGLVYSLGDAFGTINPVELMLTAIALSVMAVIGGKIKVWDGNGWIERPIKAWMGSDWVEKPMKYWTGSTWELT